MTRAARDRSVAIISWFAIRAPRLTMYRRRIDRPSRAGSKRSRLNRHRSNCPRISIVTPSLNQGDYLGDAIESVIRQDYPHVEHLVVESGSTDSTSAVLEHYSSCDHLRVIQDIPPRGQSHAVNVGLRAATGQIIGWLNADDRYSEGALEAAVEALLVGQGDLAFGHWDVIDAKGDVVDSRHARPFDLTEQLNGINRVAQPTVFFRRSLLDTVGYLDESLDYVMDYDLWLRAARVTRFILVDRVQAQFRLHSQSKTVRAAQEFYSETRHVARRNGGPFFSTAMRRERLSLQAVRNWRRRLFIS